jgi:catechol 2,3-dioxygenase-like lactoylglutathione lyase family enzyme
MEAKLDHVVLWVEDPERAVGFYAEVVGLTPVRAEEYRAGRAPFPSARVSPDTLLDLVPRASAGAVDAVTGAPASAGHPVNHVCLALRAEDFEALHRRLEQRGIAVSAMLEGSFGARGVASRAFYFRDPDGNVLEVRHYPEGAAPTRAADVASSEA